MTRADSLLILLALLGVGVLYYQFWSPGTAGQVAYVHVDGKWVETVPLDAAREVRIQGPHGTSVLQVRPGAIRFIASPCTGKYCVQSGWHTHGGEFAACVPNHVSVHVSGGTKRFDAVNF